MLWVLHCRVEFLVPSSAGPVVLLRGGIYKPVWRPLRVEGAFLLYPFCDACKTGKMSLWIISLFCSRAKREIPFFSVWRAAVLTSSVFFVADLWCESDAFNSPTATLLGFFYKSRLLQREGI